jgi:hypothetical protein
MYITMSQLMSELNPQDFDSPSTIWAAVWNHFSVGVTTETAKQIHTDYHSRKRD